MTAQALPQPPVLLITDRRMAARPLPDVAAAALKAGCRWMLVREKDLDGAALTALVTDIVDLARPLAATVSVSGRPEIAERAGAQGVHLPQAEAGRAAVANARRRLGPRGLVGVSAHDIDEALTAARDGADYVTLSPIFLTASKPGYGPAVGLGGLADIAACAPLPVLALAGVGAANAAACRNAGAAGIAVMGSMMRATDPEEAMAALIAAWET